MEATKGNQSTPHLVLTSPTSLRALDAAAIDLGTAKNPGNGWRLLLLPGSAACYCCCGCCRRWRPARASPFCPQTSTGMRYSARHDDRALCHQVPFLSGSTISAREAYRLRVAAASQYGISLTLPPSTIPLRRDPIHLHPEMPTGRVGNAPGLD